MITGSVIWKNIMGMWMINSARNELAPDMSFSDICEGAQNRAFCLS